MPTASPNQLITPMNTQQLKAIQISITNKVLPPICIFSAIFSMQAAFATDYIACREMLKTKNELQNSNGYTHMMSPWSSINIQIRQDAETRSAATECEKKYSSSGNFASPEEVELRSLCISNFKEQRRGYWESLKSKNEQDRQRMLKKLDQKLNKLLAKIKRDMKNSDCPYE
jgi:hypothetical protein